MDRLYLQHDHTDLLDTLDDGVGGPRDGHCPLRGVGQHVPGHLDLGTCGLERPDVGRGPTERGSVHCSGTSWVPPGVSRAQHALGRPPTLPQVTPTTSFLRTLRLEPPGSPIQLSPPLPGHRGPGAGRATLGAEAASQETEFFFSNKWNSLSLWSLRSQRKLDPSHGA